MLHTPQPFALVEDALGTQVLGYSVPQILLAGVVVGAGIWVLRQWYHKALGKS